MNRRLQTRPAGRALARRPQKNGRHAPAAARAASRVLGSPYIEFARLRPAVRYDLATSGVANFPLAELNVKPEQLEINGPTIYGYPPLQERLARHCGVTADCVVAATGTSMANHLALAALIAPGDEVLIEEPAYDPLLSVAGYLGAKVRRFPRRAEDGFELHPQEVRRHITRRTRLVVITNLHNPSSAYADEKTLVAVGEIARAAGARVLVDEVYAQALFRQPWRSAFHLGPNFVITSSLTKAYGLSGLRCGWILAPPPLAQRMWRLNDLFAATPAHPAELLSVIALDHLPAIAARAGKILAANRARLHEFLDARPHVACVRPRFGTTAFPRLPRGSVEEFCARLEAKYEISVVPGRFFEMPQHFRVGLGGDPQMTAEGLRRLGKALDEYLA